MSILERIAAEAGVSAMTVARVLGGERTYARAGARDRAQRIRAIAERLHYRRSQAAQAVRTGRFGAVTLVVAGAVSAAVEASPATTAPADLPHALLDGVLRACAERDLHLSIAGLPAAGDPPHRPWRERASDGLLLYRCGMPPDAGVPGVLLGQRHDHDCVHADERGAGAQAARWVLRQHSQASVLAIGDPRDQAQDERLSGWRQGLDGRPGRLAIPPVATRQGATGQVDTGQVDTGQIATAQERIRWSRTLISAPDRPTAAVCATVPDAVYLLLAAADLGIDAPRELTVVAIDDGSSGVALGLPMTRLVLPNHDLGRLGIDRLLTKIAAPDKPLPAVSVPYVLGPALGASPVGSL
jgi:LacI family transcriptional regulator